MSTTFPGNPAGGGLTNPAPGRHVIPGTTAPTDGDAATGASVLTAIQTSIDWPAYFQLGGAWRDALGGGATSFDGPSNPAAWNDMLTNVGAPVSGLDVLPTFAAASGFAVTIGAFAGHLWTSVNIHPGESPYREIYSLTSQNVTLANPDATNPRIDAITVAPATFGTPSSVAVVTGTPGATYPLAPAIPSGSGALFYVYVPPGAASSASFRACRGLGRRVGYPFSGMSGVLAGCGLLWDYTADPSAILAGVYFGAPDLASGFSIHRLLIDGELLEWAGFCQHGGLGIVSDSTADPFASAASASFDRPYYFYACGGRHNPLPSAIPGGTPLLNPVTICESTVPPDVRTGKPTVNLTVNGVTVIPDGAVYIGLGFVVANTTRRRGCVMDGEMTSAFNPLGFLGLTVSASGRNDLGTFAGHCQPAISTKMLLSADFINGAGAGSQCAVFMANFPSGVGGAGIQGYAPATGQFTANYVPVSFSNRFGSEIWAQLNSGNGSVQVYAMGFNHRVRRLAGF